jgi:diadenosine tetraphosphate (Ap4A) HIT family hydrolase
MNILFPNQIVTETKYFIVAQDWEVPIPGFFVLSARRDIRSLEEFDDAEAAEFGVLLKQIRRGMRESLGIDTVYFFQNEDSAHGFHVWIFPRHEWMERFGKKIQSVRPIMEFAVANMNTDSVRAEVNESVKAMERYLAE